MATWGGGAKWDSGAIWGPSANADPRLTWRVGVDWNADGFVCWDTGTSDALNLLAAPLKWSDVTIAANGSATLTLNKYDQTDYGLRTYLVETTTGTTDGLQFGDTDDIPADESTPYSVGCWVYGLYDYASVDVELLAYDQGDNLLGTSSPVTLSAGWQQVNLTFSTGAGDSVVYFVIRKATDASEAVFYVTGWLLVSGATMPSAFNSGAATDVYDNLSDRWMDVDWSLGIREAYQYTADESRCRVTVTNDDKRFSPEYASSPLYGYLLPNRQLLVEVYDNDYSASRRLWTGFVEVYEIVPGASDVRRAVITGVGVKQWWQDTEFAIPLLESKTADEILVKVMGTVTLPAAAASTGWLIGIVGRSEIGETTELFDLSPFYDFQDGLNTYPYVGDQFDEFSTVWDMVAQMMMSEQGKFYFDRFGKARFLNREHFQTTMTAQATLSDMISMTYSYGDKLVNDARVTVYPRAVQANAVMWSADESITISGGDEKKISARFKSDEGVEVFGRNLVIPNAEDSSLVVADTARDRWSITDWSVDANKAEITIQNDKKNRDLVITALLVRGDKLTAFNAIELTALDQTSFLTYGRRPETLALKLLNDEVFGQSIADWLIYQRASAQGLAKSVMLMSKADFINEMLLRSIGDRVAVDESQTAHAADYFVIGESHRLEYGGEVWRSEWFLEPASQFDGWLIGTTGRSEIGETTRLGL